MTPSEELVSKLCNRSFLSLWSYPNPRKYLNDKNNKELCDVLVVCDPYVIIFSIKEKSWKDSISFDVAAGRWQREAIKESVDQIYGAERIISKASNVITQDRKEVLPFPDPTTRRIFRVAIALGSAGNATIGSGDFDKGYIHVFDEEALDAILNELDTVTDFVQYLADKEDMGDRGVDVVFSSGGEENLLGYYLLNNRSFPQQGDFLIFEDGIWANFAQNPQYIARKEQDRVSYEWDRLIETIGGDYLAGTVTAIGGSLSQTELVLRTMAKEDRLNRRVLAEQFFDFIEQNAAKAIPARIVTSNSGIRYVFLAMSHSTPRDVRLAVLGARCHVARGIDPKPTTVVGIATESYDPDQGTSFDICYLQKEVWTNDDQIKMDNYQTKFKYFTNSRITSVPVREYPANPRARALTRRISRAVLRELSRLKRFLLSISRPKN